MASIDVQAFEIFYTTLLCLSAVVITWFAVYVIYKLFRGQS